MRSDETSPAPSTSSFRLHDATNLATSQRPASPPVQLIESTRPVPTAAAVDNHRPTATIAAAQKLPQPPPARHPTAPSAPIASQQRQSHVHVIAKRRDVPGKTTTRHHANAR